MMLKYGGEWYLVMFDRNAKGEWEAIAALDLPHIPRISFSMDGDRVVVAYGTVEEYFNIIHVNEKHGDKLDTAFANTQLGLNKEIKLKDGSPKIIEKTGGKFVFNGGLLAMNVKFKDDTHWFTVIFKFVGEELQVENVLPEVDGRLDAGDPNTEIKKFGAMSLDGNKLARSYELADGHLVAVTVDLSGKPGARWFPRE